MRLPLRFFGDPVLRKKTEKIVKIDDKIHRLAADMVETMFAEDGCGLAAPQIGVSLAIFVIVFPHFDADGKVHWLPQRTQTYINPKIVSVGEETQAEDEACLSIPGLQGMVIRPQTVVIEATNLRGEIFQETHEGYNARQVFHENDHLNGVLFIDRMHPKERRAMELNLQKLKKKFSR